MWFTPKDMQTCGKRPSQQDFLSRELVDLAFLMPRTQHAVNMHIDLRCWPWHKHHSTATLLAACDISNSDCSCGWCWNVASVNTCDVGNWARNCIWAPLTVVKGGSGMKSILLRLMAKTSVHTSILDWCGKCQRLNPHTLQTCFLKPGILKDIVKYPQRNAKETNIFHIAGPRWWCLVMVAHRSWSLHCCALSIQLPK